MTEIEVFADPTCPFAYVGFTRIVALRETIGPEAPRLRTRSWPLEVVNGEPFDGAVLVPKVAALRRDVAPDLFHGFAPDRFPRTSLSALAAEQAAFRAGADEGMAFSLAVRRLLFEEGADIGDPFVVDALVDRLGLPRPTADDRATVDRDYADGVRRGVEGSPHFFTPRGDYFCPTLDISSDGGVYSVTFDRAGFEQFIADAFGMRPA